MSNSKSPFKRVRVRKTQKIDIETLFKDLKNRSPNIRDLFAHQADILREYYKSHIDTQDVGIELPTGSGKTLVGLLIGEWRRRTLNQRVLYVCPTKQLTYQVNKQSKDYGIDTRVFVGSKRYYDMKNLTLYRSAQTIAVSTYSGLFNVSPGIDDPQTIILDDAHGAETYIGSMWSLDINRQKNSELYLRIIEIFQNDLPGYFLGVILRGNRDYITHKTEKVPFGAFYRSLPFLRNTLDSKISDDDLDLYFSWRAIRDGLYACHVYISYDSILIRPYIPPTLIHKPFSDAEQRIYMSASLGRGGELERITGIREIQRIPTPKTYKSRGIGRRFFIFPDFSLNPSEYNNWIAHRLSIVDRTLVLCPHWYKANQFEKNIVASCSPKPSVLGARDIEESMDPFTKSDHSILLLANRYDGIDLPNGICRQMIIDGLPSGTNLQEAFLEERLGLDVLLRERIKTRIQQASGRCTRSDTDIAAIIMLDRRLFDYCARVENQKRFHPEIRAEMRFSFEQNMDSTSDIDAMLESFMNRDENWSIAEQDITDLRMYEELPDTSLTEIFDSVVKFEVDFSYAMWAENYERAVICGKRVADGLSGLRLTPYRALWYYFVAAAANAQSKTNKEFEGIADDYLNRAKSACQTVSWFPHALRSLIPESTEELSEIQALAVEGVINCLNRLGPVGPRFTNRMDEIEENLKEVEASKFDLGLMQLGGLLGFTSYKPGGTAAPDAVWYLENHLLFLFEGKSAESPDTGVTVQNCRQTSGHLQWVTGNDNLKDIETKYSILVSPKTSINEDSIPYGKGVHYLHITEVLKLFERAKQMLIELRSIMTTEFDNTQRQRVLNYMIRLNLTPEEVCKLVTSKLVTELPVFK